MAPFPPSHLSAALRRHYRNGGARAVADFLLDGLRAQLHKQERLAVIEKDLADIPVSTRRERVRVEPLERRHLLALRELNRERGDLTGDARFAEDLDAGYGGFVGFAGDALVSCYWWTDGGMPRHRDMNRLGLGIELGAGDVYGFDLYVDKAHRAGGTAMDFLTQVETRLRELGFERLWGWVAADNRMARWTYDARGYRARWIVVRSRTLRRWRNRITLIEGEERVLA
jgi:GNAT superfamily N-acetyltransferase